LPNQSFFPCWRAIGVIACDPRTTFKSEPRTGFWASVAFLLRPGTCRSVWHSPSRAPGHGARGPTTAR
jgi:hypothetical protein